MARHGSRGHGAPRLRVGQRLAGLPVGRVRRRLVGVWRGRSLYRRVHVAARLWRQVPGLLLLLLLLVRIRVLVLQDARRGRQGATCGARRRRVLAAVHNHVGRCLGRRDVVGCALRLRCAWVGRLPLQRRCGGVDGERMAMRGRAYALWADGRAAVVGRRGGCVGAVGVNWPCVGQGDGQRRPAVATTRCGPTVQWAASDGTMTGGLLPCLRLQNRHVSSCTKRAVEYTAAYLRHRAGSVEASGYALAPTVQPG
jgi:hypothetical protein